MSILDSFSKQMREDLVYVISQEIPICPIAFVTIGRIDNSNNIAETELVAVVSTKANASTGFKKVKKDMQA